MNKSKIHIDDVKLTPCTLDGYLTPDNKFYRAEDEYLARWSSCTHISCSQCGKDCEKMYTVCSDCRKENRLKWYKNLPSKEWDEENPLYSDALDEYFWEIEDLWERVREDEDLPVTDLDYYRLQLTKPNYLPELDYLLFVYNELDPNEDSVFLPSEVIEAAAAFNKVVNESKTVVYYNPVNIKPIIKSNETTL